MKKKIITILVLIISFTTEAQVLVVKVVDSLLLQGNYQKALKHLEHQEIKTITNFDKTASIYQSIGNHNKAIEFYVKALKIKEIDAIKVKLGKTYNSAGLSLNAIKIYEEIIQKDSTNLLVANSLGKLYLSNRQIKKAAEIYQYLKKKDTLNPNYPYQLGVALGRQKKLFEMGDSYLEAFKRDSMHIKSIYRLAKFFKDLKFKDSTKLFIDKGLKIDKNSINFNQLKANSLYASKDYKGAIKHLKRLDSLNYKSVNTFDMFGMAYLKLDDDIMAEKYFKKALKIDRRNSTITYRLASLYYKRKENKKAMYKVISSIYYGKPDLDRQYYLLAIILKEDNKLKMAIVNFEKSFQNNSQNYKALFELATTSEIYYKDKKIAYKHYQKYIDKFEERDKKMTDYAKQRANEIKKEYFLEGEILD
ncbi:MAG: hypothetical protein L3J14_00060 [Flavobacteriaceae bacterium]|nr:hypothetical protein [Flavobacteriaceae bacterium]